MCCGSAGRRVVLLVAGVAGRIVVVVVVVIRGIHLSSLRYGSAPLRDLIPS